MWCFTVRPVVGPVVQEQIVHMEFYCTTCSWTSGSGADGACGVLLYDLLLDQWFRSRWCMWCFTVRPVVGPVVQEQMVHVEFYCTTFSWTSDSGADGACGVLLYDL